MELPGVFGHISLRPEEGHSVVAEDRRPWSRDIALYLADLTRSPEVAGPGTWTLLARGNRPADAIDGQMVAELHAALARARRQLHLLGAENARLRGASDLPEACNAPHTSEEVAA